MQLPAFGSSTEDPKKHRSLRWGPCKPWVGGIEKRLHAVAGHYLREKVTVGESHVGKLHQLTLGCQDPLKCSRSNDEL